MHTWLDPTACIVNYTKFINVVLSIATVYPTASIVNYTKFINVVLSIAKVFRL